MKTKLRKLKILKKNQQPLTGKKISHTKNLHIKKINAAIDCSTGKWYEYVIYNEMQLTYKYMKSVQWN